MRWTSTTAGKHCDDATLAQLLDPQADESLVQRTASHLDHCSACQDRLTQLSATSQWWLDAGRWLEPEGGGASAPSFLESDEAVSDVTSAGDDTATHEEAYKSLALSRLRDVGLLVPSSGRDETGTRESLGRIGRYDVSHVIGFGGTGIVLRAVDRDLSRVVAIKVLSPELAVSGPARKRFAREGQACAAVAHENVVSIHQVEAAGKAPYLVMQYINGQSLEQYVCEAGPLSATETLRLTAQIASALSAAHDQGLVHRDVKPANVLVERGGQRVWITDFGLARAVDDASLTRTGFIAGTPHYMSPEQARGESISSSSDLFGLGSVVYFMLTGRPPFRAERTLAILNRICTQPHRPVREVIAEIPEQVEAMVDRLLAKLPDGRYGCAVEVRDECLRILAEQNQPRSIRKNGRDGKGRESAANSKSRSWLRPMVWLGSLAAVFAIAFGVVTLIQESKWQSQQQFRRNAQAITASQFESLVPSPRLESGQPVFESAVEPKRGSPAREPLTRLLQQRFGDSAIPSTDSLLAPGTLATSSLDPAPYPPSPAVALAPLPTALPDYSPPRVTPGMQVPELPSHAISNKQIEEPEPTFGSSPEELAGWLYELESLANGIDRLQRASQSPGAVFGKLPYGAVSEHRHFEMLEERIRTLQSELK